MEKDVGQYAELQRGIELSQRHRTYREHLVGPIARWSYLVSTPQGCARNVGA